MKRSRQVAALCATAVLAAACGRGSTGSGGGSGGGSSSLGTIGVDYPRSDTDFWNSYISYMPKMAATEGVTIKTTNSQNDVQKLIANVQALQGQGAKALVLAPQDTAAAGPAIARA